MGGSTRNQLDEVKAALRGVESSLAAGRKSPFWFLKPAMWRKRRERDALRAERVRLEAECLREKEEKKKPRVTQKPAPSWKGSCLQDADVIITAAEMNNRHGTGVLLQRLFPAGEDFIHVRSMDLYGGETSGGLQLLLPPGHADKGPEMLVGSTVRRILSVPYCASDVENTLTLSDVTGAPVIAWLMDHHLGDGEHQIPEVLMQRLLDRAQLRLGISPEFCALYESMFGHKVHFAPPVVEAALAQRTPLTPSRTDGALLGNLWSQKWLEMLARTLTVPVTSYGHNSPQWVKHEALAAHVTMRGFLPEEDLVHCLRQHAYAIVPTGTLDEQDDLPDIARYSLPSRTLYLSAVANLPIIVLGHEDTGVARFVKRHGLGIVSRYEEVGGAVEAMRAEGEVYRARAAELADTWACDDMREWLWTSLEQGGPADDRWERL